MYAVILGFSKYLEIGEMSWIDGPWQTCMGVSGLDPSACATWVQAWGSIGAILAAGIIAAWQIRVARLSAERAARAKRKALVDTLRALTRALSMQTAALANGLSDREGADAFAENAKPDNLFAEIERSLAALPLHEMPDTEAIKLVVRAQQFMITIRLKVANILRIVRAGPDPYQTMKDPLKMDLMAAQELDACAKKIATSLELID